MGIAEFLSARLDEEYADALAAQESDPAPWRVDAAQGAFTNQRNGHGAGLVIAFDDEALWDCEGSNALCMTAPTARHVARWDPAHVLRDVEAKRAIVEDYVITCRVRDEADTRVKAARATGRIDSAALDDWGRAGREASILEGILIRMASPHGAHPDYNPAWKIE
jgi:hypothetical protein